MLACQRNPRSSPEFPCSWRNSGELGGTLALAVRRPEEIMQAIQQIINNTKAYYCLECGKCTAVCPISRREPVYSPRLTVERAIWGEGEGLLTDLLLWSCLTCQQCYERCPSAVHYVEFIRDLRALARGSGQEGLSLIHI